MTQRPLVDLIPDIMKHVELYADYSEFNRRLYRVHEGQVKEEVEKSLAREIISQSALKRIKERIPSINIIRKATDKLSKVYIEAPNRMTDNKEDKSILDAIERESNLNRTMTNANQVLNYHHMFAIEPYIDKGKHMFRVLAGHQFLPFSDDPVSPNKMTVFIKYLGTEIVRDFDQSNENGTVNDTSAIRELSILALYSDDEWMIIDSGGKIRVDKMREIDPEISEDSRGEINPFGRIPYIYGNRSEFELIPFPNQQGFDITVLIPKLYADLNYAAQFMTHSILWSINTDLEGKEFAPDTVLELGESDKDGSPELHMIKPEVDIDQILSLIGTESSEYFSSIGIKTSTQGTMANGRDSSALAKAIDEGDTTAERKVQTEFFRHIELRLMDLLKDMQKVWSNDSSIIEKRRFSEEFIPSFMISYAEMRPIKTFRQKAEEMVILRDQKLISRKRTIKTLYPDMTDAQVDSWIKEVDDELIEQMQKQIQFGVNIGPDTNADGTFTEGNQAAAEQDETSKGETDVDERTT